MLRISFTYNQKSHSLRFRRWSRKRYAAFVSLHHNVTMGCLSANVADRLHGKQNSLHNSEGIQTSSCNVYDDILDKDILPDDNISLTMNICKTNLLPVVLNASLSENNYKHIIINRFYRKTEDAAFIWRYLLSFFIGLK